VLIKQPAVKSCFFILPIANSMFKGRRTAGDGSHWSRAYLAETGIFTALIPEQKMMPGYALLRVTRNYNSSSFKYFMENLMASKFLVRSDLR
jgi:hypothetical protein